MSLEGLLPSFLYHSGVGWFNPILQLDIFLETDIETYSSIPFTTHTDPLSPEERARYEEHLSLKARRRQRAKAIASATSAQGEEDGEEEGEEEGEGEEGEEGEEDALGPEFMGRHEDGQYTSHFLPLLPAGHPISGVVRVQPSAGRTIPYASVVACLEVTLYGLDDVATRTLYSEEVTLCGAGEFSAPSQDLPFCFRRPGDFLLAESYEGSQFSVRHAIFVRVERPWYTFDCSTRLPLALQRIHDFPFTTLSTNTSLDSMSRATSFADLAKSSSFSDLTGGGAFLKGVGEGLSQSTQPRSSSSYNDAGSSSSGGGGGGGGTSLAKLYSTSIPAEIVNGDWSVMHRVALPLSSWPREEGSVVLHLKRALYELSDVVKGQIQFTGITRPIVLVKLAVVRIEYADGVASDTTIFDDCVMDARRWKERKAGKRGRGGGGGGSTSTGTSSSSSSSSGGGVNGVGITVDGGEGGEGEGVGGSGVGGAASLGGMREWWPSEEDLKADTSTGPDPDLPIVNNVSLSVDLDLSQLNVSPTIVITNDGGVEGEGEGGGRGGGGKEGGATPHPSSLVVDMATRGRSTSAATAPRESDMQQQQHNTPPGGGKGSVVSSLGSLFATSPAHKVAGKEGGEEEPRSSLASSTEISVRFFLRITVYTDFNNTAKMWDAQELFLFRGDFYGRFRGEWKKHGYGGRGGGGGGGAGGVEINTSKPTINLGMPGLVVEGTPANSPPNSRMV